MATDLPAFGEPAADADTIVETIDRHFNAYWREEGVTPSPESNDAEFLRRATLDTAGRIPTAVEVRAFLADDSPDKRGRVASRLVRSPEFSRHAAGVLRRMWMPQTEAPPHDHTAEELETWLSKRLRDGASYDAIARELLTAPAPSTGGALGRRAPATFLLANEMRPEDLAANTTREFLGANLECAQCHDHPYAAWSQEDFWRTAAFFADGEDAATPPELLLPETDRSVAASLWTGEVLRWPTNVDRDAGRRLFAEWVTSPENAWFSRNLVNRWWDRLLGAGLHQPLDDLSTLDESPHAELIDTLAAHFVQSGFDIRSLTVGILRSRVYQQTSLGTPMTAVDNAFAAAPVRGLTGEQLYDSLLVATGRPLVNADLDSASTLRERARFVKRFRAANAGKPQRSVVQSLALMNGDAAADLVDADWCPTVTFVAESPFLSIADRVELLFITVLSRPPSEDEAAAFAELLATASTTSERRLATSDAVWAMVNSIEFNTNH